MIPDATAVADAIRRRDVSAAEVVDEHLHRIARSNPALNAIVTLDAEGARTRAREADAAIARGSVWGPGTRAPRRRGATRRGHARLRGADW